MHIHIIYNAYKYNMDIKYFRNYNKEQKDFEKHLVFKIQSFELLDHLYIKFEIVRSVSSKTLRKKCLYSELFSPNVGKCSPE